MVVHKQLTHPPERIEEEEVVPSTEPTKHDKLKAHLDEILDEIDEVLEENVEMAQNFVQKGGE